MKLNHTSVGDIAILYRTNAQSRVLEEMLMRAGISYKVFGGLRFYDRKEVRDIIAYLRVMVNPADDVSLKRIINQPKRTIGDATIAELSRHAQENDIPLFSALSDIPESLSSRPRKCVSDFALLLNQLIAYKDMLSLSEFVKLLIDKTGLKAQYEKDNSDENRARLENMMEFLTAVTEFEQASENPTLEDYLENVALVTELDQEENRSDYVTLMTLHSAKGLEFPVVFMTGLEEGVFPSGRSLMDDNRLEEERSICYVGITRTRERLFISYASQRMFYNQLSHNAPSRFLNEIPKRLLDDEWASRRESFHEESPAPAPMRQRPVRHQAPSGPLGVPHVTGMALGIPGVQKGFTPSAARGLGSQAMQNLFKKGDRVMHRKFGEGNVVGVTGSGSDARIQIEFTAYGVKEFALSIAPIVKIS